MPTTPHYTTGEIAAIATEIRELIVKMLLKAGTGHSAGPLGMADVFATLYFSLLNHDPKNPSWEDRDRLILSNGHICPVLYATLARAEYFPLEELWTLRSFESRLQGHPHLGSLPGIENTSGPLGQGLSQACGLAYAFKMDDRTNWVYAVLSDGEHQEGQTWEAYLFAGAKRLNNLTVLIDRNNIQIDGYTEEVMPLESLRTKLEGFGWNVLEVDGHNPAAIATACRQAQATQEQPTAIICHTIPGKGVSFMQNEYEWHGKPPNKQEARVALAELRSIGHATWWE